MKSKLLEKGVSVECKTAEEVKKVLKICKDINIKWVDGQIATKYYPRNENYPKILNIGSNGISVCFINGHYSRRYDLCTANEFIEVKCKDLIFPKQEIHITRKDNEVHAILKENDKVIKRTVAKCHPEDEFDFKVGSKLVYDRLFEKDNEDEKSKNKETNKLKYEFKVGDKVRIRQWDDMAEEFGVNYGIINVGAEVFSYAMKYLCGKIAVIKATGANNHVCLEFKGNVDNTDYWVYTTAMLEPYAPRVAKAGEYIRVFDGEDKGKIFKCTKIFGKLGDFFENSEYYYSDIILFPEQYEVLNDYTPPLNCRFVVLKDVYNLTKGKIYEIKNGRFKDDEGGYFPNSEPLKNKNDLKDYFSKDGNKNRSRVFSWTGVRYIVLKED